MGNSTHTAVLKKFESLLFRLTSFSPLSDYLQSFTLCTNTESYLLSSTVTFMVTVLLILLTAFRSLSCGYASRDFLLNLTIILFTLLMRYFTSIFTLSSLWLVNSETRRLFTIPRANDFVYFKRGLSGYFHNYNWLGLPFWSLMQLSVWPRLPVPLHFSHSINICVSICYLGPEDMLLFAWLL